MTKMQAVVSSASMMFVSLSLRRSRRLLASSQALACSTTQRTVPSRSRAARLSGGSAAGFPRPRKACGSRRCDRRHRHRAGRSRRRPPRRGAAGRETASCRARWRRKAEPPAEGHRSPRRHGYLVPRLALSVGFGPVSSPPCLARTLQLSMITSQAAAAACGPERTMRTRAACTRCSRATALHSMRRRRSVAPRRPDPRWPAAPAIARLHAERTAAFRSTTAWVGQRGRP